MSAGFNITETGVNRMLALKMSDVHLMHFTSQPLVAGQDKKERIKATQQELIEQLHQLPASTVPTSADVPADTQTSVSPQLLENLTASDWSNPQEFLAFRAFFNQLLESK